MTLSTSTSTLQQQCRLVNPRYLPQVMQLMEGGSQAARAAWSWSPESSIRHMAGRSSRDGGRGEDVQPTEKLLFAVLTEELGVDAHVFVVFKLRT